MSDFKKALEALRGELPEGKPAQKEPERGPARAVVRMERKGRGGKEVTVVEQLGLPEKELEKWLKDLKNALGCGGALEKADIVLQGDQRKRLPQLLQEKGVRKVTVG
jgi:translation initiation factor 1